MHNVEPKVYLIGKTLPISETIGDWLKDLGVSDQCVRRTQSNIPSTYERYDGHDDLGAELIRVCGKRCYMSFEVGMNPNVTKVREDLGEFIENILKVAHGSVLEHVVYNFAIEGVSRVFTGEMNRHRAGMAISEGSMRYIRFDDIAWWMPTIFRLKDRGDATKTGDHFSKIGGKRYASQEVFRKAFNQMEENYKQLCEIWKDELDEKSTFKQKKMLTSAFRRIIGMGVATGGIWSGNIRALRHIFTMRCDEAAEEEICMVANMMLERMIRAEPLLFRDFEKVDGYWQPKYRKV